MLHKLPFKRQKITCDLVNLLLNPAPTKKSFQYRHLAPKSTACFAIQPNKEGDTGTAVAVELQEAWSEYAVAEEYGFAIPRLKMDCFCR